MAARPEPYRPRRFDGLGLWPVGDGVLKAYGISATPEPVETARIDAAKACVAALTIEGPDGGFVILHRGEEAMWLLVHWWMPGGMLAERLFPSRPRHRRRLPCR
ncbi:hypothetical protein [Aureimonas pseudogalii]|uniref:Uncharacterized protein n=1 Tax=Aureimonas pseudogalii TaxID=1744844 RepID=A0A7W6H437_9HYPH|nr:hypothetical protein [Aureimonas pseudogalii]MBB3997742.1 hypothetical protein [Aureimonas pseudogalii]